MPAAGRNLDALAIPCGEREDGVILRIDTDGAREKGQERNERAVAIAEHGAIEWARYHPMPGKRIAEHFPIVKQGIDGRLGKHARGESQETLPAPALIQIIIDKGNLHEREYSVMRGKRCLDIAGGIIGIGLMLPFLPVIALAIKTESKGPVCVRLRRISEGKVFWLYKFRTMIQGAEHMKPSLIARNERRDGPYFKMKDDPRITRVGRMLRRFRIDEWPQFWNVIRGDMAIVGPRPYEPEEIAVYPEEYAHIPKNRAGITGLSQISGSSALSFKKTLELDDWYIRHPSLWLDLKIIAKTAVIAIFDNTAI